MTGPTKPASDMMTTREVAEYLRIKERKVYDLVRLNRIPCTRVTGKLLFPRGLIDRWMAGSTASVAAEAPAAPPVVAGSRDPLLDWAVRESGSGLALMAGGSEDGLRRLAAGAAMAAGIHLLDPETGSYNAAAIAATVAHLGVVAIEWAWREEGLLLPAGNSQGIRGVADLARSATKVVRRQPGAGARVLLDHLVAQAGLADRQIAYIGQIAMTGQEVGLAILEGKAAAGIGLRAVARQLRLDFLPLATERFDIVLHRRDYFEPPFQKLLEFARTETFRARAPPLGGDHLTGQRRGNENPPGPAPPRIRPARSSATWPIPNTARASRWPATRRAMSGASAPINLSRTGEGAGDILLACSFRRAMLAIPVERRQQGRRARHG